MKRDRIHSAGPSITAKEIETVMDAIQNGWYSNYRHYLERFEKEFAEYVGVRHAIATTSCTTALHLGVATLGLKEGDEVILPDLTWVATASVLIYEGVKPVTVDIDPDSWTIDPDAVRKAITPRTRAIMPVDLYGHPCDYDEIMKIAVEHGLKVLSDAAPAVGSLYKGKSTAAYPNIACYSFQGAKMMVTGEGGMLVTNDDELFERAAFLAEDGRDESKKTFWIQEIGYHYKIANLLAALGVAQLERVEELVAMKRKQFDMYYERLGHVPGIKMFREKEGCRANCAYPSLLLEGEFPVNRDELRKRLRERKIDTRPLFPPLSEFDMFDDADTPVAKRIAGTGINLPTPAYLDQDDVDYICGAILEILEVK
ncbi:MAG TPA: DegT/DnrJ/EryC1/StrS family aminotransferase [archaeon]|nr:DegT/DnrJ/EryC1/StrS family aminotransferase [archaeon]